MTDPRGAFGTPVGPVPSREAIATALLAALLTTARFDPVTAAVAYADALLEELERTKP